jgi:hypothetical protein
MSPRRVGGSGGVAGKPMYPRSVWLRRDPVDGAGVLNGSLAGLDTGLRISRKIERADERERASHHENSSSDQPPKTLETFHLFASFHAAESRVRSYHV